MFDEMAEIVLLNEGRLMKKEDWILLLCLLSDNEKSIDKSLAFLDDYCNELDQLPKHANPDINAQ